MNRTCPHCGATNRVPAKHAADVGRCGSCKRELPVPTEPIKADTALFTELVRDAGVPVLVDFWAPWCGPCKMAAPEVVKAAAGLAGKAVVVKVNTDENPVLANQYAVRSIPTFAVFRAGLLQWRQSGVLGHRQLEQAALAAG